MSYGSMILPWGYSVDIPAGYPISFGLSRLLLKSHKEFALQWFDENSIMIDLKTEQLNKDFHKTGPSHYIDVVVEDTCKFLWIIPIKKSKTVTVEHSNYEMRFVTERIQTTVTYSTDLKMIVFKTFHLSEDISIQMTVPIHVADDKFYLKHLLMHHYDEYDKMIKEL